MARRYRKRSKRKQEESLGELLATATAIITLFVTKGNLVLPGELNNSGKNTTF